MKLINKKILKDTIFFIMLLLIASNSYGQEKGMDKLWGERTAENSNYKNKDYQWYQEAKFGMFIHWGIYSNLAGEWNGEHYYGINEWIMKRAQIPTSEYKKLSENFDPIKFKANEIADLAVNAGMKYVVITAKHHDGFALFESKASDFNIMDASPFERDIIKELANACRAKGLKFGFYYSQTQDWTEPNGFGNTWDYTWANADFPKYLKGKALPQIKELLTNYGEIGCIFFDTPGPIEKEEVLKLKEMVEKYQPNCLINSRIGQGLGDFVSMGDNEIPEKPLEGLWETPDTHNNTWAYSKLDINWKTPEEIIHRLINVISKGGNYMFNIGPKGDGSIPEMSQLILKKTGDWIKIHQEAIYGSEPVYIGSQANVAATRKGNKTFIFIKHWPNDGKIWLPSTNEAISKSYFLDDHVEVKYEKTPKALCIKVPIAKHRSIASVIVLEHQDGLVFATDKIISSGMKSVLFPHEASIQGAVVVEDKWMEIFGDWHSVDNIVAWEEKGSKADWSVMVPQAGTYTVEINYSCDAASDLQEGILTIDTENYHFVPTFSGQVGMVKGENETRKISVYKTRKIGVINIQEPGKHRVGISLNDDDKKGWIKLSKVILNPI